MRYRDIKGTAFGWLERVAKVSFQREQVFIAGNDEPGVGAQGTGQARIDSGRGQPVETLGSGGGEVIGDLLQVGACSGRDGHEHLP